LPPSAVIAKARNSPGLPSMAGGVKGSAGSLQDRPSSSDRAQRLRWPAIAPFNGAARKQQIQRPLGKVQIWGNAQL
jgi:hypothetical protein